MDQEENNMEMDENIEGVEEEDVPEDEDLGGMINVKQE